MQAISPIKSRGGKRVCFKPNFLLVSFERKHTKIFLCKENDGQQIVSQYQQTEQLPLKSLNHDI
jgi:hypothetical protein